MGLMARIRGMTPGQLRVALAVLVAMNLGVGAYVFLFMPVIRLHPICHDEETISPFRPLAEVRGEMAAPFFYEYLGMIAGQDHLVRGRRIYVTLAGWLDRDWISNLSSKATIKLLAQRTGASESDIRLHLLGLPEFDDGYPHEWPSCAAMGKLALEGGEWSHVGPVPNQAMGR
jgi:hypothetical protein